MLTKQQAEFVRRTVAITRRAGVTGCRGRRRRRDTDALLGQRGGCAVLWLLRALGLALASADMQGAAHLVGCVWRMSGCVSRAVAAFRERVMHLGRGCAVARCSSARCFRSSKDCEDGDGSPPANREVGSLRGAPMCSHQCPCTSRTLGMTCFWRGPLPHQGA